MRNIKWASAPPVQRKLSIKGEAVTWWNVMAFSNLKLLLLPHNQKPQGSAGAQGGHPKMHLHGILIVLKLRKKWSIYEGHSDPPLCLPELPESKKSIFHGKGICPACGGWRTPLLLKTGDPGPCSFFNVLPQRASPGGSVNIGGAGSIAESGRSPGEGNGNSLQYSCLGNAMDKGPWWATVHRLTKSQTPLSKETTTPKPKPCLDSSLIGHTKPKVLWPINSLQVCFFSAC